MEIILKTPSFYKLFSDFIALSQYRNHPIYFHNDNYYLYEDELYTPDINSKYLGTYSKVATQFEKHYQSLVDVFEIWETVHKDSLDLIPEYNRNIYLKVCCDEYKRTKRPF